jgi:hypothetical protein
MEAKFIGRVSVDTAEVAIVDAMYMLTSEDHTAQRTADQVVAEYDGVLVPSTLTGCCRCTWTPRPASSSGSGWNSSSSRPRDAPTPSAQARHTTRW